MENIEPDLIPIYINEVKRLVQISSIQDELKRLFSTVTFSIQNGVVSNEILANLLKASDTPAHFFAGVSDRSGIVGLLVQFMIVHYSLAFDQTDIHTLPLLKAYLQSKPKLNSTFPQWSDKGKFIIYLEVTGIRTWNDYSATSTGEWSEVHLLDGSLPYCRVDLDRIFGFLLSFKKRNPQDLGYRTLGGSIIFKLRNDERLRQELKERMTEIIQHEALKVLLPFFFQGLVNQEVPKYAALLKEYADQYRDQQLADVLFAMATACPDDNKSRSLLKSTIDDRHYRQQLSTATYLQILAAKNFLSADILQLLESIAENSADHLELLQVACYLDNNLEAQHQEYWFRIVAGHLFKAKQPELVGILEHLLYVLAEKDPVFVYQLLTVRFSAIGETSFLNDFWPILVENDPELFHLTLTDWFNDGNRNVHRSILHLTTTSELSASDFKLSARRSSVLSASDKVYIAYKIVGYMYSREYLQSLLFSLIEQIKVDENEVLRHLSDIFSTYVIYNYRTTLDTIKKIIEQRRLPKHLLEFYGELNQQYEHYFAQLNDVKMFTELQGERGLGEHIQFFRQQKFNEDMQASDRMGLGAFFGKTVHLHSNRWALRRSGEKKHRVSPLGSIETTAEFPSGEKLNPVRQEQLRRTYQFIEKDAININ